MSSHMISFVIVEAPVFFRLWGIGNSRSQSRRNPVADGRTFPSSLIVRSARSMTSHRVPRQPVSPTVGQWCELRLGTAPRLAASLSSQPSDSSRCTNPRARHLKDSTVSAKRVCVIRLQSDRLQGPTDGFLESIYQIDLWTRIEDMAHSWLRNASSLRFHLANIAFMKPPRDRNISWSLGVIMQPGPYYRIRLHPSLLIIDLFKKNNNILSFYDR